MRTSLILIHLLTFTLTVCISQSPVVARETASDSGHTNIVVDNSEAHEIRYVSGTTVYIESLEGSQWCGRYFSADGRINLRYLPLPWYDQYPHESWAAEAFQLEINHKKVAKWSFISAKEQPKDRQGNRHLVVELAAETAPVRVAVHTLLDGTPVIVRWLEISNTSDITMALTGLSPWSGRFWPGEKFSLGYFTKQEHEFEGWFKWETLQKGTKTVACNEARGHNDPFFIVRNDKIGEYFIGHLAWSANWEMVFKQDDFGLLFQIGPASATPLRILSAGETIETPAVHLGLSSGELDDATQAMHEHIRRSMLPKRDPKNAHLIQYLGPADQSFYVPFNEASAFKCVDVAVAIGAEVFILDFGWYDVTCDWFPSKDRYPQGLKPLVDYVHKKGLLFGVYMESEGGRGNVELSRVAREHPDWMGPSKTVKLTVPESAAWVESEIGRVVEEFDLDLYRLDYNPWFKFGATDRAGIAENDCWRHYEAFYGMYERLHKKYPDLILQQASSGGGRSDLGTVSRFHESYLTDGLWIPRELQVYSGLTLGLPPEILVVLHGAHGAGGLGRPERLQTILRMSYSLSTPQIFIGTVAPSLDDLTPERLELFQRYGKIYKEFIRPLLPTCKMFHHEPVNSRGGITSSDWFAMEFASPDRTKGWALLVRLGESSEETSYQFRPRGLNPARSYQVTFDHLDGQVEIDGWRLTLDGLPIRLDDVGSSELLLFEAK